MPVYKWRCPDDGDWTQWLSIHDDKGRACCPTCARPGVKVFTPPNISVYATPSKGADVRDKDRTEAGWQRDMPAYKAMRRQGYQPRNIDGCHKLEGTAKIPLELEMGHAFATNEERSVAQDTLMELRDNERNPDIAPKLGENLKKMKAGV
jgi:hypothetical protein